MNKTLLNPQQEVAAFAEHPQICLLATAGSGKTRTLIARTQRLAEGGVLPSDMVVITFTNAAAAELRSRSGLEFGYCGTLHGYMLRLLQQLGGCVGFSGDITVIDQEQRDAILEKVSRECAYKGTRDTLDRAIGVGPHKVRELKGDLRATTAARLYYRELVEGGMLDFDSILFYGLEVIKNLSGELQIGHLFVDEYQDSSSLDAEIYRTLSVDNRFYVGDDSQSIFGFRGACVDNILELSRQQDSLKFELNENYRCDEVVCEAAQRLIEHNANRAGMRARSVTEKTGELSHQVYECDAMEVKGIINRITEELRAGVAPEEIAILVRTNKLAECFRFNLGRAGLPVQEKVCVILPDGWIVARRFLSLLANPENDTLAQWWIEAMQGKSALAAIKLAALEKFCSINRAHLKLRTPQMEDLMRVLTENGISEDAVERVGQAMDSLGPGSSLADLLLALDEVREEKLPGIAVSTIHKSKGLEYDVVFMPAFEQGILPNLSSRSDLEEERRLAFVGMTRARHKLLFSSCAMRRYSYDSSERAMETSQFVFEMMGQKQ